MAGEPFHWAFVGLDKEAQFSSNRGGGDLPFCHRNMRAAETGRFTDNMHVCKRCLTVEIPHCPQIAADDLMAASE
ncbi:hypothetical protein GCM10007919_25450 [Rhizobium indigoferae]|nr:hypothetical protein GCM10007919_25450 [Rhizobium indigoferae]